MEDHTSMQQISVTFDRNVFEYILNPEKPCIDDSLRLAVNGIREYISSGLIRPFIAESAFTLETLTKKNNFRRETLAAARIKVMPTETGVKIMGDPKSHPESSPMDKFYLPRAIEMGFQLLPFYRLFSMHNTDVRPEWRYQKEYPDRYDGMELWSQASGFIEGLGAGAKVLDRLLDVPEEIPAGRSWTSYIDLYKGSPKEFNRAVAEWSDGDSVASHIASGIDYFCTFDRAKGAGKNSVFSAKNKAALAQRYALRIVEPAELIKVIIEQQQSGKL